VETYVVTGASGFVGGAISRALLKKGFGVIAVARRPMAELAALGADCRSLDLSSSSSDLAAVVRGAAGVFHTAASVGMWGPFQAFYQSNVIATERLLDACEKETVSRFVFTSSPSVIADGLDLRGVDESYPYPARYKAFYPMTKAAAERAVLARAKDSFRTASLRPHLIFGPGDTNLIPTIVKKARQGQLAVIGNGFNLVDVTYIDDCVQAHLLAMESLGQSSDASGKSFFISQGEPVNLWSFVDAVLEKSGCGPIHRRVPTWLAYSLAGVAEVISRIRPGYPEPRLTRFLVSEMSTHHYFSIDRAANLLGYSPAYSVQDALDRTFS
jgi:nucleoside-diphosphate-sugar epimerase